MDPIIRPVTNDEELRETLIVSEAAFSAPFDEEHFQRTLAFHRSIESYVAVIDGEPVGSGGAIPFAMTVPGGSTVSVSGITEIGVLATHRRRGVLTAIMERLLDDAAIAGRTAAVLYASEATIYGRYGFGPASRTRRVAVDTRHGSLRPDVTVAEGRFRMVSGDDRGATLPGVLTAAVGRRPGEMDRSPEFWEAFLSGSRGRSKDDRMCMLHISTAGEPDGYALYEVALDWDPTGAHGALDVRELAAADPAVELALWQALFGVDLVETVRGWVPSDSVLDLALTDPRALSTVGLLDSLWVRLLDVPAALSARRYAAAGKLILDVTDDFRPECSGRWLLEADAAGRATIEATDQPADLIMDTDALAAQWLGEPSFEVLVAAGRVQEVNAGAARRARSMFGWHPRPWTIIDF